MFKFHFFFRLKVSARAATGSEFVGVDPLYVTSVHNVDQFRLGATTMEAVMRAAAVAPS